MVSRYLFLFFIIFIYTIDASNRLKSLKLKKNSLVLEFSKTLNRDDFTASAIKKKGNVRYIFDFKNTLLSKKIKRVTKLSGKIIKSVRVAQYKKGTVRLVIDSKNSYNLNYKQGSKPLFVITLPKNSKISKKVEKKSHKVSARDLFSSIKDSSKKVVTTPTVKMPIPTLKHNYTIMIDAGHGGKKPGTMWAKYKEKTLTLQVAKKLYRKLKTLGFNVKMTRFKDKHISLRGRIKKANSAKADLFISIHANSIAKKSRATIVHGIETYFLQTTRNSRAKRVAAKENADLLKSVDRSTKQVLLNTLFTGPKIELSNKLAIDVQKGLLSNLRSRYNRVKDNGVRGAPFYVLVGAQMPSILIEIGYMSNPKERKRLFNSSYQELIAKGITVGVMSYLKNREREME